jgi:hypothetical protein
MQIDDISPTAARFVTPHTQNQCPSGRAVCVAISGSRVYIGGASGVWRSDDGGVSWWHPEWRPASIGGPTMSGALLPANVFDIVIDPRSPDVVFAAANLDARSQPNDGIYRSTDGALTWTRVHQFFRPGSTSSVGFVGSLCLAPDNPDLLFAAGQYAVGRSTNGGLTWTDVTLPSSLVAGVVAGPSTQSGQRVYACGNGFWYSTDGGLTWDVDSGGPAPGAVAIAAGASSRSLAIDPLDDQTVFVMDANFGFHKGVFGDPTGPGVWTVLPSPTDAGIGDSGCSFVVPVVVSGTTWLYVSSRRTVQSCPIDVSTASQFTRVDDGQHADPHGIAFSSGFVPNATGVGTAVLVNDGGAHWSTDGLQTWTQGNDLSTLNAANVALNSVPGSPMSLTFAGGDNGGFSSYDDGVNWSSQEYYQGDNDCSFADPFQPTRMVVFAPRDDFAADDGTVVPGELNVYVSPDSNPPNTTIGTLQVHRILGPTNPAAEAAGKRAWNVESSYAEVGYRPLVLTLHGEAPRPDGDFVTIRWAGLREGSQAFLMRTTAMTALTTSDVWNSTASAEGPGVLVFQVGPPLPDETIGVVQASGGHDRPTFYVGNTNNSVFAPAPSGGSLWCLNPGSTSWRQIVPAPAQGPQVANRFFVDPYRPNSLYVLATDSVYYSADGGSSWSADAEFDSVITENGAFPRTNLLYSAGQPPVGFDSVMRDIQFDPFDPDYRVAVGAAGVFLTQDGRSWSPLLRSSAMALQPTSMIYDPVGCVRSLYIGTANRGIIRLRPLPPDWDFPDGSLQEATGLITMLRVHDQGTGFGPHYDYMDVEVVITLDSQPGKAFGLQLRQNPNGAAASGMLDVLRDCFSHRRPVTVDFTRTGCRSGTILRVFEP